MIDTVRVGGKNNISEDYWIWSENVYWLLEKLKKFIDFWRRKNKVSYPIIKKELQTINHNLFTKTESEIKLILKTSILTDQYWVNSISIYYHLKTTSELASEMSMK